MTLSTAGFVPLLVYAALMLKCAGFLTRDELHWRPLMLIGSGFHISYYYLVAGTPLWDAIITNVILAVTNLGMICVVMRERSTWGMNADTITVYGLFPMLSPGHFRRLLKLAKRESVTEERTLVSEGEVPGSLYFVLNGPLEIRKGGQVIEVDAGVFIAEVAFLTDHPASATVSVREGAEYLEWDVAALRRLLARARGLKAALVASLNVDLARKVANSQPVTQSLGSVFEQST